MERVWTLVAALFVHASILHLFDNMLFLFVFENTLEKTVGSKKLLMIFFTGGLTGFILSVPFMPHGTGMLGASAAIFTLAACVMLVRPLKFSWLFLAPQGLGRHHLLRLQRHRRLRKQETMEGQV